MLLEIRIYHPSNFLMLTNDRLPLLPSLPVATFFYIYIYIISTILLKVMSDSHTHHRLKMKYMMTAFEAIYVKFGPNCYKLDVL